MKSRKLLYGIGVAIAGLTIVVLISTISSLSQKNREKAQIINQLTKDKDQLVEDLNSLREDKARIDYFEFLENSFRLKHPVYAQVVHSVFNKSREYDFNPYLTMALIQVESGFNPYAVSNSGAYGLTQVNYSVWKDVLDINFMKIFDVDYNIDLGLKVLKHYFDETDGNMLQALFHYNNGYRHNNTSYQGKIASTMFFAEYKIP